MNNNFSSSYILQNKSQTNCIKHTVGEVSLGQPKGGRGHLIEMPIQQKRFKFLFFVTIISGLWLLPA